MVNKFSLDLYWKYKKRHVLRQNGESFHFIIIIIIIIFSSTASSSFICLFVSAFFFCLTFYLVQCFWIAAGNYNCNNPNEAFFISYIFSTNTNSLWFHHLISIRIIRLHKFYFCLFSFRPLNTRRRKKKEEKKTNAYTKRVPTTYLDPVEYWISATVSSLFDICVPSQSHNIYSR